MNYSIKEFFKECVEDIKIPTSWENESYLGGDLCPSYSYNGYQIWIAHRDKSRNEWPCNHERFAITILEEYGMGDAWRLNLDSFEEVLKEIEKPIKTRPQSKMYRESLEEGES
tara:strand:- start:237 stop:575 length:339 start_codon:yes stop_codon:yes gene_type:complete